MKKFITHNGTFHLDETFSYSIIRYLYPNIELIRTRDESIIWEWVSKWIEDSIIVDVWKSYKKNTFDHHFFSKNLETFDREDIEDNIDALYYYSYSLSNYIFENNKLFSIIINYSWLDYNEYKELEKISWKRTIRKKILSYIKLYFENIDISNLSFEEVLFKYFNDLNLFIVNNLSKDYNRNKDIDKLLNMFIKFKLNYIQDISYRKYSSAWLIWNMYWKDYIEKYFYENDIYSDKNLIDIIFEKIDKNIVKNIDDEDNGISINNENDNKISTLISLSNNIDTYNDDKQKEIFIENSFIINKFINDNIKNIYIKENNKKIFLENIDTNSNILYLPTFLSWIDSIIRELWYINTFDFIVYPWENETYYIKSVRKGIQFNENPELPKEWINNKQNIDGLLFCHTGLFIAQFDNLKSLKSAIREYNIIN